MGSVASKAKKVKVEGREESPESLVDISEEEDGESGCGGEAQQVQGVGNGISALQTLSSII